MSVGLDNVVDKIAALGVPGLVLIVAMGVTGWAGAAAVTAALAALGGPLGMLGGIALLGVLVLISKAVVRYGMNNVFIATARKLKRNGTPIEEIKRKVQSYPITRALKRRVLDELESA